MEQIHDIAVFTAIFVSGMLVGYIMKAWMDRNKNMNKD